MIDPNTLLPLIQAMSGGKNNNMANIEPLLKMFNSNGKSADNTSGQANPMNNMMQLLPLFMQMMNKNTAPAEKEKEQEPQPDISEKYDPFQPIRDIGNEDINNMLYNLINKKG